MKQLPANGQNLRATKYYQSHTGKLYPATWHILKQRLELVNK